MKTTNRRHFLISCAALAALAACPISAFAQSDDKVDHYTCTMHPFVHAAEPGNCPVCGMELVPVMKKSGAPAAAGGETPTEFSIPLDRQQLIGVTYATVEKKPLQRMLRAAGLVASENERHWIIVSRVQGYVQQLIVNSPGELVEKDQPLLTIYSPDLLATQRELVDLLRMRDNAQQSGSTAAAQNASDLITSAEQRLLQWNVTAQQIAELEKTREPQENLTLNSPYRGIVHHIHI
jgi:multidrug efflux pump subunit AcrA (membrane-fusion protein)